MLADQLIEMLRSTPSETLMLPLALPSDKKLPVAVAVGSENISLSAEKTGQLHSKVLDTFGEAASASVMVPLPEQVSVPSTMLL